MLGCTWLIRVIVPDPCKDGTKTPVTKDRRLGVNEMLFGCMAQPSLDVTAGQFAPSTAWAPGSLGVFPQTAGGGPLEQAILELVADRRALPGRQTRSAEH